MQYAVCNCMYLSPFLFLVDRDSRTDSEKPVCTKQAVLLVVRTAQAGLARTRNQITPSDRFNISAPAFAKTDPTVRRLRRQLQKSGLSSSHQNILKA